MTSAHLVHSFNLLLRNYRITQQQVNAVAVANQGNVFNNLLQELQERNLYTWTAMDQLQTYGVIHETPTQLCLLRALIDTGKSWPGILTFHEAVSCIQHQFESALQSLHYHANVGEEDAQRVLAKFTEYRLAGHGQAA